MKITKKLVVLFALIMGLIYLPRSQKAAAFSRPCTAACAVTASQCNQACAGNTTCQSGCEAQLEECVEACAGL